MKRNANIIFVFLLIMLAALFLSGCDGNKGGGGNRETRTDFVFPEASGVSVYDGGSVSIDASNTKDGYLMVKYSGSANKIKLQITGPDSNTYTYTSHSGDYATFPLASGDGSYKVDILEQLSGDMYTLAFSQDIIVALDDEFEPFLYPNQYVWYTSDTKAIDLGIQLSDKSSNDLDYVEQVYNYVITEIDYDEKKATNVPTDYIPNIDDTLDSGKGICFDYASLTAALLRSQGIPTKLVVGYSGPAYHAWISVYTEETGWVDDIIEFDGKNWSLMDPTLAAGNSDSSVKKYVGDGSNYTVKYNY
ncbi:MAG: transglutaminase domain-containing protein [Clostridiales bacterium]|nr:transglutaminase domain-containing protein [Clostridiales bacterium]